MRKWSRGFVKHWWLNRFALETAKDQGGVRIKVTAGNSRTDLHSEDDGDQKTFQIAMGPSRIFSSPLRPTESKS